jgi:hypothetical protein
MADVYIVTTVPESHIEPVLDAIAGAGGGHIGAYTHCAFTNPGVGRFRPEADADPFVGAKGEVNRVEEWRIESTCPLTNARAVVDAIRQAHPFETPVVYVLPLLNLDTL